MTSNISLTILTRCQERKRTTESLGFQIARSANRLRSETNRFGSNKLAIYVFGLMARDEYRLASRRNDDLGVRLRSRQIFGSKKATCRSDFFC
jgi:hypothetical protein